MSDTKLVEYLLQQSLLKSGEDLSEDDKIAVISDRYLSRLNLDEYPSHVKNIFEEINYAIRPDARIDQKLVPNDRSVIPHQTLTYKLFIFLLVELYTVVLCSRKNVKLNSKC